VVFGVRAEITSAVQSIAGQISRDIFAPNASACRNAEIGVSVSRRIAGAAQIGPANRAVENFGVWAKAIKRSARSKSDCAVAEISFIFAVELLHIVLVVGLHQ